MTLLFQNCTVLPMTASPDETKYFAGYVGVEGRRIALVTASATEASAWSAQHPDVRVVDAQGGVLMPGLINTHCHMAMTLQRNYADDIALMQWLNEYIWPFESRQNDDEIRLGALLGAAEMLLGGITSVIDMYWSERAIFDAIDQSGMRALLCASYLDTRLEAFDTDLPALLEKCHTSSRIRAGLAPHAPYTCSTENLKRGVALCQQKDLPLTIHVAETLDEDRLIRQRYGLSPVAYLDSLHLFDGHTIVAHAIHLSDADVQTLRNRGTFVAHCPSSNMKIASGIAPIERLRAEGVACTIATDGPSSNNDLDMWEEMRNASFLQKVSTMNPCAVPAYELLRMATVHGAAALGYAGELGIIQQGALADLVLLSTSKPHFHPRHDLVANIAYCAKASDVEMVVVDGEICVERGRLLHIDLPQLYAQVDIAVHRITQQ
jgi:5-methylthioadenosine/S-adenosylhomocysteine deaminase